ncbi:MAG: putative toxin-antitoxin system toxin component, PIN family [Chthoniobacterales bacterium]|nr:MAG: putative toxin-antitoxin system toxin component, PIN family [Chthoniobacterales bacterium]
MRVLFDTNVLFAAFTVRGFCQELVEETVALVTIIWSPALQKELVAALRKKDLLSKAALAAAASFAALCEMHPPVVLPKRVSRDRDDDIVLGVAVAGRANVIITGDNDLLVVKKYERVRIMSPRQFLELLHSQ